MSLIALKRHLMQAKLATLNSLCLLFNAEPDTVRCLMRHLIQKGNVRQCLKTPACGSKCFSCPTQLVEMYEWVEAK